MKNPMTPAEIEPATFRFVAQHLNHCATPGPRRLEVHSATCPVEDKSSYLEDRAEHSRLMQKLIIMWVKDKFSFESLNIFTCNIHNPSVVMDIVH